MDAIGKMQTGHSVEDIDIVIDEVYEARGDYGSLEERLDDMSSGTPAPASSTPEMDGTGSAGSSDQYARADHVHPSDTSRASAAAEAEDRDALIEIIDSGAKNLLKITAPYGQTVRTNITFTHNADENVIVTASEPNSLNTDYYLAENMPIKAGEYVLSGCPIGGDNSSTYKIQIAGVGYDTGNNFAFTISEDTTLSIYIRIWGGYTPNNIIFKPMLCTKTAWDISHEYQPYRPPYQELYERVVALEQANGITRSVQTMKSAAELPEKTEPEEEGEEVR